jgi:hypothetical protein
MPPPPPNFPPAPDYSAAGAPQWSDAPTPSPSPAWPPPSPQTQGEHWRPAPDSRDEQIAKANLTGSVWATNALAVYSLILAAAGLLTSWMCGAGFFISLIGILMGFLAFKKSMKLNGSGRKLAIFGIAANCVTAVIGFVVLLVLGWGMVSL